MPTLDGTGPQGPIVAGTAVILTGDWLKHALDAVLIAARTRARNGLHNSAAHLALGHALTTAMSATGQTDVREPPALQHYSHEPPTVTVTEAAHHMKLTERQTRRLAPKLGGQKIAGRWLLDQDAIDEHLKGQK